MAHQTSTQRREARVRRAVKKAARGRLRLSIFRSSKHIYAQVIDDTKGATIAAASSIEKALRESLKTGADVRVSGVKVGTITGLVLKPGGYRVNVSLDIRQGIPIPSDSKLAVSSGIMSSSYLDIRPGHSRKMLAPGATLHAS